ncbi:hypothetical protein CAY62_09885 [Photobacterium damselae subsp. damselae]|nr:hypothetical protein CAY62_09885 [Photobacterium damselae subsp. damselae]
MYGHLRTYKKTAKSLLKNIVCANKDIDFDLFISTWDQVNVNGTELTDKDIEELKILYSPIKIDIINESTESYIRHKEKCLDINNKLIINTNYHIINCQKMITTYEKNNGFVYDYILLTRPDIFFSQKLKLDNLFSHNVRGGIKSEFNNVLIYPYIISDYYGQIMDSNKYICGIDLFSIYSRDVSKYINDWDLTSNSYSDLLPEFALTKVFSLHNVNKMIIGYEKDRSYYIQRQGYYFFYSGLFLPFRIATTLLFYLLFPIMIVSGKFRQKIFFNIHLLSIKRIKRLWGFLK